jgi:Family of unknown function (DUF5908)
MPIEIRELVIRATLASGADERSGADEPGADPRGAPGAAPLDVEAIVQECVRQVLRVLARERER